MLLAGALHKSENPDAVKDSTISFSPTFRLGLSGIYIDREPFQWFFSKHHSKPYGLTNNSYSSADVRCDDVFLIVDVASRYSRHHEEFLVVGISPKPLKWLAGSINASRTPS
jgi:hypothetical protein